MRATRLASVLLAAACFAGCGLGAGESAQDVTINVTRDYGAGKLKRVAADGPGEETVMRALQRRFDVKTRFGGAFVQAIDGLAGGRRGGRQVDWFFYVNGVEGEEGAAAVKVHPGDRIWWDNHDWQTAPRVPAVVGTWPEPFRSGRDGRRLPVRVDCAEDAEDACDKVSGALQDAGVKVSKGTPRTPGGADLLRVLVGRWPTVRADPGARLVELGPQRSGVFARFDRAGTRLELMNARTRVVDTLGAGAGLIAATRYRDEQPVWLVTGTDDAGVRAAAGALTPQRLNERFALVVTPGGDRTVQVKTTAALAPGAAG